MTETTSLDVIRSTSGIPRRRATADSLLSSAQSDDFDSEEDGMRRRARRRDRVSHKSGLVECWPVIDPGDSRTLNAWDIFIALLLVILGVLSPFETAFLTPQFDALFAFNRCVDLCFVIDMVLQFFISFPDPQRPTVSVKNPWRIWRNYVTGWFCIDFLSVLPIDLYMMLTDNQTSAVSELRGLRNIKVVRLFRLIRLLRLARFKRLGRRWQGGLGLSFSLMALAKFALSAGACCHWIACIWGYVAMHACEDGDPDCATWLTVLQSLKGGPVQTYNGPFQVYSIALYWAVVTLTTVGYGDIVPVTDVEYHVATLCTSLMASLWAYVIGAVCGIVATMDLEEVEFRRTMDDLNEILSEHDVPQELRKKLRKYIQENREVTRQRSSAKLVGMMSPQLRGEVAHFMNRDWMKKVHYLAEMPEQALVFIAEHLLPAIYSPNEHIFFERTLCIIRRGICLVGMKVKAEGQIWGEDMLLSNPELRDRHPAKALTFLSVLLLRIEHLVEGLAKFPESCAKLRKCQARLAMYKGVMRISCAAREFKQWDATEFEQTMQDPQSRRDFFAHVLSGKPVEHPRLEDGSPNSCSSPLRNNSGRSSPSCASPRQAALPESPNADEVCEALSALEQKMNMLLEKRLKNSMTRRMTPSLIQEAQPLSGRSRVASLNVSRFPLFRAFGR